MLSEFKEFIAKGNVMDLAVAEVHGGEPEVVGHPAVDPAQVVQPVGAAKHVEAGGEPRRAGSDRGRVAGVRDLLDRHPVLTIDRKLVALVGTSGRDQQRKGEGRFVLHVDSNSTQRARVLWPRFGGLDRWCPGTYVSSPRMYAARPWYGFPGAARGHRR